MNYQIKFPDRDNKKKELVLASFTDFYEKKNSLQIIVQRRSKSSEVTVILQKKKTAQVF